MVAGYLGGEDVGRVRCEDKGRAYSELKVFCTYRSTSAVLPTPELPELRRDLRRELRRISGQARRHGGERGEEGRWCIGRLPTTTSFLDTPSGSTTLRVAMRGERWVADD